uniref:Glutaredoxin domain-containing protein n=1 Tax=Sinocyclocheilus grahami TaxID=75366 RepID=A0A672KBB2_SINGR
MVKKDKVVVFMKGTPAQPMCGFSNAVVQILRMHGVDSYAAYNVLDDQDVREEIISFSNWKKKYCINEKLSYNNYQLIIIDIC